METLFKTPQGEFQLRRLPYRKNDVLRAWDAADEYLLQYIAETAQPEPNANIVIANDGFGALAVALHAYAPTAISDSFLSRRATLDNLRDNDLDAGRVTLLDSLTLPESAIDYLLIKIPKTLGLLEYQLHLLRPLLRPTSKVVAASMVKNMPPTAWKLLERLVGPTTPSLTVKKARLIFADFDPDLTIPANPYPVTYPLENSEWLISNHANVFSRDSLDIGTRFLLQHLPENAGYREVIDLGCGNGVVGMKLAEALPEARISFVDESFMAIASARENFHTAFGANRQAQFIAGDGLNGFADSSADCIVCNPPFHQQHAVGDQIAWRMLQQAHRVLRPGGELRVIGNRHLNYHQSLKQLFGHWDAVANNSKFSIVKTVKR